MAGGVTEPGADDSSLSTKGERTRERILESALELFREHGYDATTMRMIAEAAGVSLGNSYYYFPSKDHLVQAFYWRVYEDRVAAVADQLADERDLLRRLRIAVRGLLDVVGPYHRASATMFRTAADPSSPLNPFSASSAPTRNASIALLREVVGGSDARLPRDVTPVLPHLLNLYELGVILFWVHDRSPKQRRTYELVEDSTEAIVRLLSLSTMPGLRAVRRRMLHWVSDLISEPASG